ncbi:MAG: MlaD family protein [Bacteroidota bacterium]|nr:MCE family protein [Flavisolibacter sp.]MDQ3846458.1 MlaD family protein [Bacteroidota bacterium]
MKTSNKRAVTVGIFIFLGLIILIAAVMLLGGQKKTFEKKIQVSAIFDDVGGLQEGNNVWFSGVKIGTIRKMRFHGNSQVEVIMNIEQKAQSYIRRDAKARISSEGFIGNKLVMIEGGTMRSPMVTEGDILGVEKALNTDEMMATLQENNRNLLDITNDFKNISKRIATGQGNVGKLLNDESLVNSLQATAITLRRASEHAQSLTADIADYTSRLQAEGSLANSLITDTVIFSRLRSTAMQMQEASRTASAVTDNLKMASNNLTNSNTPIGTLLTDQETAQNIKLTLRNLQSGTEKLDENMEALQHNFLLRGFFRKKAKREAEDKSVKSVSHEPIQEK